MMENSKGSINVRNLINSGKHALLPPKIPFGPFLSISPPPYTDFAHNPQAIGPKPIQKPRHGNPSHQRTSSESHLIEDHPSWLDDLLDEPETPVRSKGHRRSSSDSFAYVDLVNFANVDYTTQDDFRYKDMGSMPSWISQDFDHYKDARNAMFYGEGKNLAKNLTSEKKQDSFDNSLNDLKSSESMDGSHANNNKQSSASDTETKRAKQQFAQRSRVRKLQYIAELERNVQALQAEGSGVSAELEFLNQKNIILSLENKALGQRLDSLAQEQLIKYLEQEVLERELVRLKVLLLQQQQKQQKQQQLQIQQQSSSGHRRSNSRDLDTQLTNLSLKQHKDSNSSQDPVTGPLRI